jgi:alpha-tubulin suppressor-like RCC1 family protein
LVNLGAGAFVTQIEAGNDFTCALIDADSDPSTLGGSVRCWGNRAEGRLGYGAATTENIGDTESPATGYLNAALPNNGDISLGALARQISAGGSHTCALLEPGDQMRCWGKGDTDGRLGIGAANNNIGDTELPDSVAAITFAGEEILQVSAGTDHTCALVTQPSQGNGVFCWGSNSNGQLGTQNSASTTTPTAAVNLLTTDELASAVSIVAVVAGNTSTCALFSNGRVKCWGLNSDGQLGYGPDPEIDGAFGNAPGEVPADHTVPIFSAQ